MHPQGPCHLSDSSGIALEQRGDLGAQIKKNFWEPFGDVEDLHSKGCCITPKGVAMAFNKISPNTDDEPNAKLFFGQDHWASWLGVARNPLGAILIQPLLMFVLGAELDYSAISH